MFDAYLPEMYSKSCRHQTKLVLPVALLEYKSYLFLSLYRASLCIPRKISAENMMSWHFPVLSFSCLSCWCGVTICSKGGPSLCRSVLRTVCCYGLLPRGLCVHSFPKNRACLWQHHHHHAHMWHVRAPSQYLSDFITSMSVFPSISSFLFLSPPGSYSVTISFTPQDLSFPLCCLHSHSLPHIYLCLAHDRSSKNSGDTW